jgi:predicted nucleotidyltransferase component of viral defense system
LDENKKNYIFEQIENILKTYGLVKKADKKRYSLFYLLSYDAKIKDAQNIKVEINIRNFGSKYENKRYLGINLKVMIQEDMVANKLVAMYERMGKANRDIFDVWYFLHKNWPVNKKIVESRTTLSYKQFLQKCISELENLDNKSMLSGLGELLNTKQKAWVKEKLKNETIFLLKLALANE